MYLAEEFDLQHPFPRTGSTQMPSVTSLPDEAVRLACELARTVVGSANQRHNVC